MDNTKSCILGMALEEFGKHLDNMPRKQVAKNPTEKTYDIENGFKMTLHQEAGDPYVYVNIYDNNPDPDSNEIMMKVKKSRWNKFTYFLRHYQLEKV